MAGAPRREESGRGKGVQSSRPLHNFTLPTHLNWGHQKQLRCVKPSPFRHRSPNPSSSGSPASISADHLPHRSISPLRTTLRSRMLTTTTTPRRNNKDKSPMTNSGDAAEIEAVREKLISDLRVAADQLKLPILEDKEEGNKSNVNADEKRPPEEELPWNLRTRRAAGKAINEGTNVGSSSLKRQDKGLKGLAAAAAADKGEAGGSGELPPARPTFSLTLSKEEIEADFLSMTGAKPPRRPKKRARNVQKQLNALVPGAWLTEVVPENYKVSDTSEPKGDK